MARPTSRVQRNRTRESPAGATIRRVLLGSIVTGSLALTLLSCASPIEEGRVLERESRSWTENALVGKVVMPVKREVRTLTVQYERDGKRVVEEIDVDVVSYARCVPGHPIKRKPNGKLICWIDTSK